MTESLAYLPVCLGVLALLFAVYLIRKVGSADPGTERMQEIASGDTVFCDRLGYKLDHGNQFSCRSAVFNRGGIYRHECRDQGQCPYSCSS